MSDYIFSTPGIILLGSIALYVFNTFKIKYIDGEIRTKNALNLPSYTQKQHQLTGRRWSLPYDIYFYYKNKKFELNQFQYAISTLVKNSPRRWIKNLVEKYIKGKIDAIDLTKQLIVFGAMGSGKTVLFWNLLAKRSLYKRAIVFDTKGDYRKLVNNVNNFTLNVLDKNSIIWDIFEEKNFYKIVELFTTNLMNQVSGETGSHGNFFINSAADRLESIFERTYLKAKEKKVSSSKRWDLLREEINNYEKLVKSQKQINGIGENKDVYNNLILALKTIKLWAWRASNNPPFKFFTLENFFSSKYTYVLHQNSKGVQSFYAGFLAALIDEHTRQEELLDNSDNFTLYLLDEYFRLLLDDGTRTTLHTLLRSKGAQVVIGVQTLPKKEVSDIAFSSKFAYMVFRSDGPVLKHLQEELGKIEFKIHNNRPGIPKKHNEMTDETRERFFIDHDEMENLPKYSHLMLNLLDKVYFLGKVTPIELKITNTVPYEEVAINEFKLELHKDAIDADKIGVELI